MKRIKQTLGLLAVILCVTSCKKEHVVPSTTEPPVFYFTGVIGGVNISLDAGINNYYMYSSYTQDSTTHMYNFTANLKQTNSNENSFEIKLNDYKISGLNSNTQPDSSFHIGSYSYYSVGVADTVYNTSFTSSYTNGTAQTYTWTFGDGTSVIGTSATQSHTYATLGSYNVCLAVSGSGGVSNVCNTVDISSPAVQAKKTSVSSNSTGNAIYFNASASGFTPGKYIWSFGDGSDSAVVSNSINSNVTHTYSTSGLYHISLVVKDSTLPDSIITNYNASTATYTAAAVNFNFSSMTPVVTTGSTLRLSDVTINWTDASGTIYTTDNNAPQPAGSYFKILSEEAYQNNMNNQLTRKLHVNFSCTLYSGSGAVKQITNADAVIAMAYK